MSQKNRPAEKPEQKKQILDQEEKAGVNKTNTEGTVDSTAPLGQQGGEDSKGSDANLKAPREGANDPTRAGGLSDEAPASSEPSETDTATANAPNDKKMKAEDSTVKENSVKAASKPKNEAADGPGNKAKRAASDRAEAVEDDEDFDDEDEDEDEDEGPRDEQPESTIPEGMGTTRVRITKATRSLRCGRLNIMEELKRTSLNVGDEITVADNIAQVLVDRDRAVVLDGDEVGTRDDVMRLNRKNPSPRPAHADEEEEE